MRLASALVIGLNVLAITVALAIHQLTGVNHFEEKGFVTVVSTVQLLVLAALAWRTYRWRTHVVWLLAAAGFVFLAADEALRIHEGIDKLVHSLFNIQETGLSDRLDDLIMGFYGLVAVAVLVAFRDELRRCRARTGLLAWGFLAVLVMVALDALTNRNDVLALLVGPGRAEVWAESLGLVEDSLKLVAQALFVLVFIQATL